MTSEDVRNVTFERGMRGYRPEDVDDFLQQVANDMDVLIQEKEQAERQRADFENKLYILAQKVEEYRGQEETLKTALLNAQRMGETVVYEAKQKAETMMREATGKAELLRQQAEQDINNERFMLEKMRDEVDRFKTTILSLYKQHIESFAALDAPVLRVKEFLEEFRPENETASYAQESRHIPSAFDKAASSTAKAELEAPQPEEVPLSQTPENLSASATNVFEGVALNVED